jgi:hypothetical protein
MKALTLITLLSKVPWGQVIDAAPKVADGATRLWKTVARRQADDAATTAHPATSQADAEPKAQIAALRASVAQLQDEMQLATELIKDLAEQNAALVQRVELNRRRLQRQTAVLAILLTLLAAASGYLLR